MSMSWFNDDTDPGRDRHLRMRRAEYRVEILAAALSELIEAVGTLAANDPEAARLVRRAARTLDATRPAPSRSAESAAGPPRK